MKRLVPIAVAAVVLANSSCHLFSKKKPAAPKESKSVATEVERDFMRRWVDKRAAELVAQGSPSAAAHDQAVAEFKSTFTYIDTTKKLK